MKIAIIIFRTLLGLFLLFASLSYFFGPAEEHEMGASMKTFTNGLAAATYLLPLAKSVELICGLAFVSGKYVRLASIVLLPVTLNILLIHVFMAPNEIPIGATLFLANVFFIYQNWSSYKAVLEA